MRMPAGASGPSVKANSGNGTTGRANNRRNQAKKGIVMEAFDYIVVGGGTAGCVLAARLSQDPGQRVLLLEAGAAVTSAAMADPAAWPALWHTSVDWAYETVPQSGADDAVLQWPRGKIGRAHV